MKINSKLRLSLVSLIVLGNIISTFYTRISPKKTLRKEKTKSPHNTKTSSSTIVEYKVTARRSISYYLPYLVKMGIIAFPETQINYDDLTTVCDDSKCHFCNMLYPNICYRCATGYYLNGKNCEINCPEGYITDVLKGKCYREEEIDTSTVLSKVYTVGSCSNQCGNPSLGDCSCDKSCKKSGTCCYDYMTINCDRMADMSKSVEDQCKSVSDCDLCDSSERIGNKLKCNQCVAGKYIYKGECFEECPMDTQPDRNNVCLDITPCSVENCTKCQEGLISKCKNCERGYYLFNGTCRKICPLGYRADRISWTCLEYPVFSWYYIVPSNTCQSKCQIESNSGCGCDGACVRRGDCCQDFEEFCLDFAILRKSN